MKTLIYSTFVCFVICLAAFVIGDLRLTLKISFGLGMVLLVLSTVFSGSLVSGNRIRSNYHTSTEEDTNTRFKWTLHLFIMSVPFFCSCNYNLHGTSAIYVLLLKI